jgi:hypothetical protein
MPSDKNIAGRESAAKCFSKVAGFRSMLAAHRRNYCDMISIGFFLAGVKLMGIEKLTQMLEINMQFNPVIEIERICGFIRAEVKRRGVRGVVIGLSGGLDSSTCAYLCARCLPAKQIHLLSLPERDSSSAIHGHAQSVALALSLPLEERDLSELFNQLGLYGQVPRELAEDRPLLERSMNLQLTEHRIIPAQECRQAAHFWRADAP